MSVFSQGGFLVLDKPEGPTSHDMVRVVRRALHTREVGHAGTLDPFASGVLIMLVGQVTRLAEAVSAQDKTYVAVAKLGTETTTDDREGEPVQVRDAHTITASQVEAALGRLVGPQMQLPPAFSAKHVNGERAYELARRGQTPELKPVPITVHTMRLEGFSQGEVRFEVRCSKGTYVRALARDLGRHLGTGAHLMELRRTSVGPFTLDAAVTPEAVSPGSLNPVLDVTRFIPAISVDKRDAQGVLQGRGFRAGTVLALPWPAGERGVVCQGDRLLAVAQARTALAPGAAVTSESVVLGRRFPAQDNEADG